MLLFRKLAHKKLPRRFGHDVAVEPLDDDRALPCRMDEAVPAVEQADVGTDGGVAVSIGAAAAYAAYVTAVAVYRVRNRRRSRTAPACQEA